MIPCIWRKYRRITISVIRTNTTIALSIVQEYVRPCTKNRLRNTTSRRKMAVTLRGIQAMLSRQRKNACTEKEGASKQGFTHLHMHPWPRQRATMCVLGLFSVSNFWSPITASSSSRNATNNDDDNSFWSSLTRNSRIQRAPYCWSAQRRSIYFGSSAGGTIYDDLCACAICIYLFPDITVRDRLRTSARYPFFPPLSFLSIMSLMRNARDFSDV